MKNSKRDRRTFLDSLENTNENSALNVFDDPYPGVQQRHIDQIISGQLNTIVVRKFRMEVFSQLKKSMSPEDAENMWQHRAQEIIRAHMIVRYGKRYKNALPEDTVEKIKTDYPGQLQYLADISSKLEKGMTPKQIAFAIDQYAVIH